VINITSLHPTPSTTQPASWHVRDRTSDRKIKLNTEDTLASDVLRRLNLNN